MDQSTYAYLSRRDGQATQQMAAVPPPPGVTQNFDNPQYATHSLDVFVAIGLAIAGLFIVMRVYTKAYLLRNFGAEDGAIIMAFLCAAACCACILQGVKYGTGRHIWDIPITTLIPNWGIWVVAATILYVPSMMFAKLAILLCYFRISAKRNFRIALYIAMGIVLAYSSALIFTLIFGCSPIQKTWDLRITTGSCINRPAVYLSNGILNVATDFMILLLPVPMIKELHMPLRQKILVGAMFSVGSLACVVSIIRLRTLVPTLHDPDQTWAIAIPGIWIVVEICLAVSCGCLSVIRPFLRHHFPMFLGETSRHGAKSSNRYSRYHTSGYLKGGHSIDTKSGNGISSTNRRNIDVIALADRDDSTEIFKPYPEPHHNGTVDELRHDEEIANPRKSFERDFGMFHLAKPEKALPPGPGQIQGHERGPSGVMTPSSQSAAARAPVAPRSHKEAGIMRTVEVDIDRGTAL